MTPRARLINELQTNILFWYGVDFATVKSGIRTQRVKRARDACSWYLIDIKGLSAVKVGTILDKDATSVRHGSGRHAMRTNIPTSRSVNYSKKLSRYQPRKPQDFYDSALSQT